MVRSIMGLQEVRSQLLSLERRAVIAADGALEMAADEIVSRAQSYAPERTGDLRRSIEKRSISRRRKVVVVGAWYAPFVEFGRRGMSPRPFLRPAVDALGRRVMDRVAAKIHVDLQSMRLNRPISV